MNYDRFRQLAATVHDRGGIVPVWKDMLLDTDTPVSAFAKVRRGPFAFLLESAPAGSETWSRYTYMGTEPRRAWRLLRDGSVDDWTPDRGWHATRRPADPLADLQHHIAQDVPAAVPELGDFWTGAIGYFGYDVVRYIERLPHPSAAGLDVPDAVFVFTKCVVIIDNLRAQARVVAGVTVPRGADDAALRRLYDEAVGDVDEVLARLHAPLPLPPLDLDPSAPPATGRSTYERPRFLADVARIREYILAGDCFQAQLARRIDVPHDFESSALYRALRAINPSPYMYHLVLDGVELVGSSPELLVRVADGRVTVRPIAGTRRRGHSAAEDAALGAELLADEKERAEHVMLVDLGRNDVGRVAEFGTVAVTELMVVEQYSHVLHIVSQVEGMVAGGRSALDVFRATFPAGTLTGAPKVRAMEIIDELEPERRGPYGGAIGYIAAGDQRMDLAITIRTCVLAHGVASVQAAAGIVADSVPEREWEETENKARAAHRHRPGPRGAAAHEFTRQRAGHGTYILRAMLYTLSSVEGEQSFDLRSGAAQVIGRALTSDIPVFDPTISRRHASLTTDDAGIEVRDLGSSNGTFVNGAKVSNARITAGDVVAFGKVSFLIVEREPAPLPGISGFAGMPTPISSRTIAPAFRGDRAGSGTSVSGREGGKIVRQLRVPESDAQAFEAALRHRPSGARVSAQAKAAAEAAGETVAAPTDHERSEQKLALLLEVSKGLTRVADVGALLEKIAGFCLQIFDVDYVSVLLADANGAQIPAVARDRNGAAPHRSVPQSIVRSVVNDKVAILSDNAPEDVRFGGESILMQRVRSTMCAPLVGGEGQVLGVLYVDNVTSTHRVDEEDLEFLAAFAGIAAVAIEHGQFSERIRHELVVRSNFERYFAPNLAARIAESSASVKLGGDKRPVAVLFSDIRGFTALSRSMTPDDMAALLSEYFTEMVDCVFRHGGTLDKFMGDAVLAQWGAPIANVDDPDRAMRAAIDMMHALEELNTEWRTAGRPELAIGIGLSYGEVFAGNIGSERRLEFTVIGDTVNLASRLCSAAEAGEILISEDIRRVLTSPPPLDERPPLELKGNAHPVPVYRVATP